MSTKALSKLASLHALEVRLLEWVRSPLLLAIRLYWGWQFFQTGTGKLANIERTTEFFASLGIPAARLNVYAAALTETIGGILLLLGLGSRVVPFALIGTMTVAYATAHRDTLAVLFSDSDKFVSAPPFLFLYAAVLVLVFGPGAFSLDRLVGLWWTKKQVATLTPNERVETTKAVC